VIVETSSDISGMSTRNLKGEMSDEVSTITHEPKIPSFFSLAFTLRDYFFFKFFLNSFWADSLALGWRGLGTTFRRPCLANIRYTVVSATL